MKPVNELETELFAVIALLEISKAHLLPASLLMSPGFPNLREWQDQYMNLGLAQAELKRAMGKLDLLITDFAKVLTRSTA
jgi:hypothetical protein